MSPSKIAWLYVNSFLDMYEGKIMQKNGVENINEVKYSAAVFWNEQLQNKYLFTDLGKLNRHNLMKFTVN